MRVVVIGLGVSGDAVIRYTRAAGHRVTVIEDAPGAAEGYAERVRAARGCGADVLEGPERDTVVELVTAAALVVPSPGVPARHAAIATALRVGVPVRSEIDLGAEAAGSTPIVAVTGTNGKTSVTTLACDMLVASGVDARAAGNIGTALLDACGEAAEVLVAEVSSFQLAFTTAAFRPRVAALLNLADDHLDWHGSEVDYSAAKARVFRHQTAADLLVFNADDEAVSALAAAAPARRVAFSLRTDATGAYHATADALVAPDGSVVAGSADVRGTAEHDRANALAAAAAALEVGATVEGVRVALRRFEGLPHRLALVGERDHVRYYDDSKATNPHATLSAIEGASSPVVLIAGGRNKGLDLSVLRALAPRLRAVVAIGEAATEIDAAFAGVAPVTVAGDMHAAVARASELADSGDAVILSPACASFDWYPSYGARGDDFAAEVARLPARHTGTSRAGVAE